MLAVFAVDEQSWECRVEVDVEGIEWWHGTAVCSILSLSNPTLAIQRHVDSDFRRKISWGEPGSPAWYVNEAGLYQLVFASKSARAIAFQRWVFKEVLPVIRKTGRFGSVPNNESTVSEFWQLIDGALLRNFPPEQAIALHKQYQTNASQKSKREKVPPSTEWYMDRILSVSLEVGEVTARDVLHRIALDKRTSSDRIRQLFQELANQGKGTLSGSGKKLAFKAIATSKAIA